ncbi:hypothetical protein [Pontiella sp.]|uniref:hypothetical protein n=1 Tax=Pontiella sp. TaxID=2837462 RepID=UPI0035628953
MAKYTLRGSDALDQTIDEHLRRIAEVAAPHCRAGILLGGYGRGEGTPFINADGSQSPFNDYDLVVVVGRATSAARRVFQTLETQLSAELGIAVDLCPYSCAHLRKCAPSLLDYEMKHGHRVVWGRPDLLDGMPDFQVPLSEGTRLLLNRGKLLLDLQQRLENPAPLSEEERIRFIKFIHKVLLAFGDAALLAAGAYDLSYAVKKQRHPAIGPCPDRAFVVAGYRRAIELKEWGDYHALGDFDVAAEFEAVRGVFLRFLPWYRRQASGIEGSPLKNRLLNLKWSRRPNPEHPREKLYDAIVDLLQNKPGMPAERFYELQRRFS